MAGRGIVAAGASRPAALGETVRIQEVGEGEPVLFVHGAANAGTSWLQLMAALEGFRCIALDRPGCGLSEPIAAGPLRDMNAVEAYADTLVRDVLDALDLPRAHVVATSYGGYFAFAAPRPTRTGSAASWSSAGRWAPRWSEHRSSCGSARSRACKRS